MADFNLKQGYNIQLTGDCSGEFVDAPAPKTVAVKPNQFRGIKPQLLVAEGDIVRRGAPLFRSKANAEHLFTAPAAGTVKEIRRGPKRVLEAIVIEADPENPAVEFQSYSAGQLGALAREDVLGQLKQSGMVNLFRQRPFDHVADPKITPRDIFVSTFDTAPLAPNLASFVTGNETYFQAGLDIASRLTSGKVHLSLDRKNSHLPSAVTGAKNVEAHRFSGKHPAGCIGIQIHHIAPVSGRNDVVWYITVPGLIQLGKFFIEGKVCSDTIVAVTGSAAHDRKVYRTVTGAAVETLLQGKIDAGSIRHISGNVLAGQRIDATGHMGYYDYMLTIIPESTESEFVGWMMPGIGRQSFYKTYISGFLPGKKFSRDTKINGSLRSFVSTGYYEKVLPMNIYPMFLFKSILAGDIEEMEGLGIYEVIEEDVALCEYICPSKIEIQQIIRDGLALIEREG